MSERVDATTAVTSAFAGRKQHDYLQRLVGHWSGSTRTYLDPAAPPQESTTNATIESLLGGRFVRIDYQSEVMGKPHAGQMLWGFHNDANTFELLWIDSFHVGSAMMLSVGDGASNGGDDDVSVLGSYGAGDERWGWRTVLRQPRAGELLIEAFNISPAGQEERAIETQLRRR